MGLCVIAPSGYFILYEFMFIILERCLEESTCFIPTQILSRYDIPTPVKADFKSINTQVRLNHPSSHQILNFPPFSFPFEKHVKFKQSGLAKVPMRR